VSHPRAKSSEVVTTEHQIRLCALSSVILRPTCSSSSLRCCWLVAQHRSSSAVVTV